MLANYENDSFNTLSFPFTCTKTLPMFALKLTTRRHQTCMLADRVKVPAVPPRPLEASSKMNQSLWNATLKYPILPPYLTLTQAHLTKFGHFSDQKTNI